MSRPSDAAMIEATSASTGRASARASPLATSTSTAPCSQIATDVEANTSGMIRGRSRHGRPETITTTLPAVTARSMASTADGSTPVPSYKVPSTSSATIIALSLLPLSPGAGRGRRGRGVDHLPLEGVHVVRRHHCVREALLGHLTAPGPIELGGMPDAGQQFFVAVAQESRDAVVDDLRGGTACGANHRGAARQRLDHRH